MYKLREQLSGHYIYGEDNERIYIHTAAAEVWTINKRDLSRRRLLTDVKDGSKGFCIKGNTFLSYNGDLVKLHPDGSMITMGKKLRPHYQVDDDLIVTDRSGEKTQLVRITADGEERWRKDIKLSFRELIVGDTLYYRRIDGVYNIRPSIINQLSLSTGEFSVLADLSGKYLNDIVDYMRPKETYYGFICATAKELMLSVNDRRIIGIDRSTGLVNWVNPASPAVNESEVRPIPLSSCWFNERFYLLYPGCVRSLDVTTRTIINQQLPVMNQQGKEVRAHFGRTNGNQFFYAGSYDGWNINLVCIYDLQQHALIWHEQLKMGQDVTLRDAPWGDQQRLFTCDSMNTLSIFDRV